MEHKKGVMTLVSQQQRPEIRTTLNLTQLRSFDLLSIRLQLHLFKTEFKLNLENIAICIA